MMGEKKTERIIHKIEKKTESSVEYIIEKGKRKSWKNLPQRQIDFVKRQISETIQAYPPKVRPIIASIMTACYFSVIPGAGTTSLIVFGGIGKFLKKHTKTIESNTEKNV